MFSGEGEVVPFCETIYPTGNVEDWLLNVEGLMQKSLKQIIQDALEDYDKVCNRLKLQINLKNQVWTHNPIQDWLRASIAVQCDYILLYNALHRYLVLIGY